MKPFLCRSIRRFNMAGPCQIYESATYSGRLLNSLHELYKNQVMCDLVVGAETAKFKVHKTVMAAGSDYFQALLTIDMKEKGMFYFLSVILNTAKYRIYILTYSTRKISPNLIFLT